MVRTLTACTFEIDDAGQAVAEVVKQLDIENKLMAHSVGIITCHKEFVFSGVVQALAAALPFNTVGISSTSQSVRNEHGILILTVMVLTSDDVRFETACSDALDEENMRPALGAAYQKAAAAGAGQPPRLVLAFAPLLLKYAGDQYVSVLREESGNAPVFGSVAMDDTDDYSECYTLYNGAASRDQLALVLLYGAVEPMFRVAVLSEKNILSRPARITKSEGNLVKEINGQPCTRFLEELGLAKNGVVNSDLQLLVFMIDFKDGTPPVGKVLLRLDENGDGVCGGEMPEGADLQVAYLDAADVLRTSRGILEEDGLLEGRQGLLIFSCNTRSIALGYDVYAEFEVMRQIIGDKVPYLVSASGGEICPYVEGNGAVHNRFQNNSLVICTF